MKPAGGSVRIRCCRLIVCCLGPVFGFAQAEECGKPRHHRPLSLIPRFGDVGCFRSRRFFVKTADFHGFILLAGVQDSLIFGITPVCSGLDA